MKTFFVWLVLFFATVSAASSKPQGKTVSQPSRFDRAVRKSFDEAGTSDVSFGDCYQLVVKLYGNVSRAAFIPPPSRGAVQKLVLDGGRVSRVEFMKMARVLKQRTLIRLAVSICAPLLALHLVSQMLDEIWLSLDLGIVDVVDKVTEVIMPSLSLPIINSHGMVHKSLVVLFVLALGNAIIGSVNVMLWLREGTDQSRVPPSVPLDNTTSEPTRVAPPPVPDKVDETRSVVTPLLLTSVVGGLAAFGLDFSSSAHSKKDTKHKNAAVRAPKIHPVVKKVGSSDDSKKDTKHKNAAVPAPKIHPAVKTVGSSDDSKKDTKHKNAAVRAPKIHPAVKKVGSSDDSKKDTKHKNAAVRAPKIHPAVKKVGQSNRLPISSSDTSAPVKVRNSDEKASDEKAPKKNKPPPVGRIAVGGAVVGCLKYATTVARFVGVLLP